MDLEGLGDQPLQRAHVDVGEEGVVLVEGGVGLEKGVVVGHCQRQGLVGLVELLHQGSPGEEFFLFQFFAGLEDVLSIVDLVLKQFVFGHPKSMLEETDFGLVETGVLDSEPAVAACLDLVDELEQGAFLEQAVTNVELDLSQDLEKLQMVYLGRPC